MVGGNAVEAASGVFAGLLGGVSAESLDDVVAETVGWAVLYGDAGGDADDEAFVELLPLVELVVLTHDHDSNNVYWGTTLVPTGQFGSPSQDVTAIRREGIA